MTNKPTLAERVLDLRDYCLHIQRWHPESIHIEHFEAIAADLERLAMKMRRDFSLQGHSASLEWADELAARPK